MDQQVNFISPTFDAPLHGDPATETATATDHDYSELRTRIWIWIWIMGKSVSKQADVTDTGVVNSNFIVTEEAVKIPLDLHIIMYIIAIAVVLMVFLQARRSYRRGLKKALGKSRMLETLAMEAA